MFESFLKPIKSKEEYSKDVQQMIEYEFYHMLYKPILLLISEQKKNAKSKTSSSAIIEAIRSAKIFYADGHMYGSFSSATSRILKEMGGTYNKTKKAFVIPLSELTVEIRTAIADKKAKSEAIIKQIDQHIAKIKDTVPTIQLKPFTEKMMKDLHIQFNKVTPQSLQIPMQLDSHSENVIKEEYTNNLQLVIKDMHEEAIVRLREKVQKNVATGFRADKLISAIQQEHETTKRKAQFIAKQETSLLVSKYRQVRYEEAGVYQYRWSTSGDERVRSRHKELDNRIFRWDDPPVVDMATGRRGSPGTDYGCRCVALPVIKGII